MCIKFSKRPQENQFDSSISNLLSIKHPSKSPHIKHNLSSLRYDIQSKQNGKSNPVSKNTHPINRLSLGILPPKPPDSPCLGYRCRRSTRPRSCSKRRTRSPRQTSQCRRSDLDLRRLRLSTRLQRHVLLRLMP